MMRVRFKVTLIDDRGFFRFTEELPLGFDYYKATIRTLQRCHRGGFTMTFKLDDGTKVAYDPNDIYQIEAYVVAESND